MNELKGQFIGKTFEDLIEIFKPEDERKDVRLPKSFMEYIKYID